MGESRAQLNPVLKFAASQIRNMRQSDELFRALGGITKGCEGILFMVAKIKKAIRENPPYNLPLREFANPMPPRETPKPTPINFEDSSPPPVF
jgi:hypothetical protein